MSLVDALAGFMLVLVGLMIFRRSYEHDAEKYSKPVNLISALAAVAGYVYALMHFAGK